MSKTDPIADFLTMIRNATRAKMDSVDVEQSKMNREIL
ncbi:MAG TPA: 30S ribosomal protein S8, partial [Candidatus Omnitrophota bacterium]|nr:30S ribosomal protein S8 [Candidatus Omnitrophota bacterium]